MKYLYILLILITFAGISCHKTDDCSDGEKGEFSFGLSYCNPIIRLENGAVLEVTNMDDFDIEPLIGKEVLVKYHILEGAGSFCQMGSIVALDCVVEV